MMLKRVGRSLLLVFLGVIGAALLIGVVGMAQMGNGSSREVIMRLLDEHHVTGPKTDWWRAAKLLEHSDPARDARQALKGGDSRLLGLATVGPYLPGLPDEQYQKFESR